MLWCIIEPFHAYTPFSFWKCLVTLKHAKQNVTLWFQAKSFGFNTKTYWSWKYKKKRDELISSYCSLVFASVFSSHGKLIHYTVNHTAKFLCILCSCFVPCDAVFKCRLHWNASASAPIRYILRCMVKEREKMWLQNIIFCGADCINITVLYITLWLTASLAWNKSLSRSHSVWY